MRRWPIALVGAGAASAMAFYFASKKASATAAATSDAVATGGTFKVRATGYWPSTAKESEKRMEGPPVDRKGRALHTVEDFLAGKADHVSVSGDSDIFPYGQLLIVNWFDKEIRARVTDTGGHFRGAGKLLRVWGEEPLDFDVYSSKTPVPKSGVIARPVKGEHWDKAGKEIAASKFQGQSVVVGLDACPYCADGYHEMCDAKDGLGTCSCSCTTVPLVDCTARGKAFSRGTLLGIDILCAGGA